MALAKNFLQRVSLLNMNRISCFYLQKSSKQNRINCYSTETQNHLPTMFQIRNELKNLIGYDSTWGVNQIDKSTLKAETDRTKLFKPRMNDSLSEAIIPLGDDPKIRNRYVNFQNSVRFGRLLEDLDTMAVHIAYLHNKSQSVEINGRMISPIVIVTLLVDRIEVVNNRIDVDKNIKLSGFTSWVGTSSAEITMKVEQELSKNIWTDILEAKFMVCARDTANKGSALMNPLSIVTREEKAIFDLGETNKILRQKENQTSLFNLPPSDIENVFIHELFKMTIDLKSGSLKTRIKPEGCEWMTDTKLKNVIVCHPERRNLYNKIFGGYIMSVAYQLAWTNSFIYGKTIPRICVVDNISFRRPVLIGSILYFSSQVVYTEENYMQIRVHAETIDPVTSQREVTNDFYFKFSVPDGVKIKKVIPNSYSEAMMYLDGKRHM